MSYKKWIYKYKYLKFELEEIEELKEKYVKDFNSKFTFKDKNHPDIIKPKQDTIIKKPKTKKHPKIKELYKKLSKKLHPDIGGDEKKFKELNSLYETNDFLGMAIKAEELDLDIKNFQKEISDEKFLNLCDSLQEQIDKAKSTLSWKWANSNEQEKKILLQIFEQQHGVILKETM